MIPIPGVQVDHFVAQCAEQINIVLPHQVGNFHIGAVQGADGQRAVGHELHVAGAAGLLGRQGNLLGQVGGGNQLLSQRHVVVLHHDDPHPTGDLRVLVDQLLQAQNQVDDIFCHDIGRRGLGPENDRDGPGGRVPRLDA